MCGLNNLYVQVGLGLNYKKFYVDDYQYFYADDFLSSVESLQQVAGHLSRLKNYYPTISNDID
jgi:hypothetical protein